jgi:hypothetical protein
MANPKPSGCTRGRKFIKRAGELGKPIRPVVVRPEGFAVPNDLNAIKIADAEMEKLHGQAIDEARIQKLGLLLRHYELPDGDWRGLALKLAIEHEPGFQVDRQIASPKILPGSYVLPSDIVSLIGVEVLNSMFVSEPRRGFSGPVHVRDGEILDRPSGRPPEWSVERLNELLEAVQTEKKKFSLGDSLALERLANHKKWQRPANHRGDFQDWVVTLRRRLYEARDLKRKSEALHAQLQMISRCFGK